MAKQFPIELYLQAMQPRTPDAAYLSQAMGNVATGIKENKKLDLLKAQQERQDRIETIRTMGSAGLIPETTSGKEIIDYLNGTGTINFKQKDDTVKNVTYDKNKPETIPSTMEKGTNLIDIGKPIKDESAIQDKINTKQDKLEKDYRDMLNKVVSIRSGGLGLQDGKVNQAIDLWGLLEANKDPKTGEYRVPPSLHAELSLGLARLLSPTGQVGIELMQELRQKTAKEGLAGALIYLGADPAKVGGSTQEVVNMFAHSVKRQGEIAEKLRDTYVNQLKKRAPTGLSKERTDYLSNSELGNSFNEFIKNGGNSESNSSVPSVGGSFNGEKVLKVKRIK